MTKATRPLSNRIAIVFDFDDTLVPDTVDCLLERWGFDAEKFRAERIDPLIAEGWEPILARLYTLIEESKQREKDKITPDYIAQFGRELMPFEGVTEMFDRLRQKAQTIDPNIDVEFYIISCGMIEVARENCIANQFKAMWGCEFSYNEAGEAEFIKRLVSHTEKTRYLFKLAKGVDGDGSNDDGQSFVYRDLPADQLHVPLTQVIYVGDGASDIPCFSLLNEEKGVALGVYKGSTAQEWNHQVQLTASQRVANLAEADYREDSELMRSLSLAVESICKQISLSQLSVGE